MNQDSVGVVIIGRNEGERFRACLDAIDLSGLTVVYVDSGSTDGSVALARGRGVAVVELDRTQPFTAARARNEGWRHLLRLAPGVDYVQFVDGDCQLAPGWIEAAAKALDAAPQLAAVHGRLRERFRDASVYNRICDLEWNTPVGPSAACGGNAMLRLSCLRATGGYDPSLIAGEEPELCLRLRARGGRIERLDHEMGAHDAAMRSWRQWWRRCERAGYAYANGHALHGAAPERFGRAEIRRMLTWSLLLPASALAALAHPLAASLLLLYPVQWLRLRRRFLDEARLPRADCGLYASHCLASNFPGVVGIMSHFLHRRRGSQRTIIEYKSGAG